MNFSGWAEARIVSVAKGMLSGEIDIVEGCRLISALQGDVNDRDESLFTPMIAVASETEDVPLGKLRLLWDKAALAKIDLRNNAYLDRVRGEIMVTCKRLIQKYAADAAT